MYHQHQRIGALSLRLGLSRAVNVVHVHFAHVSGALCSLFMNSSSIYSTWYFGYAKYLSVPDYTAVPGDLHQRGLVSTEVSDVQVSLCQTADMWDDILPGGVRR